MIWKYWGGKITWVIKHASFEWIKVQITAKQLIFRPSPWIRKDSWSAGIWHHKHAQTGPGGELLQCQHHKGQKKSSEGRGERGRGRGSLLRRGIQSSVGRIKCGEAQGHLRSLETSPCLHRPFNTFLARNRTRGDREKVEPIIRYCNGSFDNLFYVLMFRHSFN